MECRLNMSVFKPRSTRNIDTLEVRWNRKVLPLEKQNKLCPVDCNFQILRRFASIKREVGYPGSLRLI